MSTQNIGYHENEKSKGLIGTIADTASKIAVLGSTYIAGKAGIQAISDNDFLKAVK